MSRYHGIEASRFLTLRAAVRRPSYSICVLTASLRSVSCLGTFLYFNYFHVKPGSAETAPQPLGRAGAGGARPRRRRRRPLREPDPAPGRQPRVAATDARRARGSRPRHAEPRARPPAARRLRADGGRRAHRSPLHVARRPPGRRRSGEPRAEEVAPAGRVRALGGAPPPLPPPRPPRPHQRPPPRARPLRG